ncbi:MAG: type IV secretion system protein [Pseudomonadota bacterium]
MMFKKKIQENQKPTCQEDYFTTAKNWYDDLYTTSLVRVKRYQFAFFVAIGLCALLALAIIVMMPLKAVQLVVVHQGQSGFAWVETVKPNHVIASDWARTQSEIANYVETREGYDPLLYRQQTDQVVLWSSAQVEREYAQTQATKNPQSPINTLGNKGYRTVVVNSILPLDSADQNTKHIKTHHDLAQVNFVVTDHALASGRVVKRPYSAIIAWRYIGVPATPQARLHNWDGFQVTKYVVHEFNTGKT